MAIRTCPKGHQYDDNIYQDNCPFCNSGEQPAAGGYHIDTPQPTRPFADPQAGADDGRTHIITGGAESGATRPVPPPPPAGGATIPVGEYGAGVQKTKVLDGSGSGGGHTIVHEGGNSLASAVGGRRIIGVLVSYSRRSTGEVFPIYEGRNLIGRNGRCDIAFPGDAKMSGEHLLIHFVEVEGIVWAVDQHSSNGTFINGNFVRGDMQLKTNDVIAIGTTKFVFLAIPKF